MKPARTHQSCIDRVVPFHLEEEARTIAIAANPWNAPPPGAAAERIALETGKMWANGQTLRVRFLDGSDLLRAKVAQYAAEWTRIANLEFAFGDDPDAEIRVSFSEDAGSWSAIGTDCLLRQLYPLHEPTMNFGWLDEHTEDEEVSRVVLHEFGHAIGCIHEHQSPMGGIQWDEDAVLAYYAGPPNKWDAKTTRFNILDRYAQSSINGTAFDPDSIMLYPFPASLTLDGVGTPMNTRLSPADIAYIRKVYPGRP